MIKRRRILKGILNKIRIQVKEIPHEVDDDDVVVDDGAVRSK